MDPLQNNLQQKSRNRCTISTQFEHLDEENLVRGLLEDIGGGPYEKSENQSIAEESNLSKATYTQLETIGKRDV